MEIHESRSSAVTTFRRIEGHRNTSPRPVRPREELRLALLGEGNDVCHDGANIERQCEQLGLGHRVVTKAPK